MAACNRCGFCTSYCPTYNASGNEAHSPRGRNQLVRAAMILKEICRTRPRPRRASTLACCAVNARPFVLPKYRPREPDGRRAPLLEREKPLPRVVLFIFSQLLPLSEPPERCFKVVSFLAKRALGLTWIAKKPV